MVIFWWMKNIYFSCGLPSETHNLKVDQVGIEPTTFTLWVCRSNRVSYKSKIVRVDGFEPPKSETPDLQSGANYRIDNTPKCQESRRWVRGHLLLWLALLTEWQFIRFALTRFSGLSLFPINLLHACQDSNLKLLVLETSTLPIELHTRFEVSTGIEPV